ncbi:hypothetical protein D3C76_562620 [compost metagenome]
MLVVGNETFCDDQSIQEAIDSLERVPWADCFEDGEEALAKEQVFSGTSDRRNSP